MTTPPPSSTPELNQQSFRRQPTLHTSHSFTRNELERNRSGTLNSIDISFHSLDRDRVSDSRPLRTKSMMNVTTNQENPTWLLSDLLSNLSSSKDKDEYQIVTKSNDLIKLFQSYPNLKQEVEIKTVLPRIQFMLSHDVSEVRSSCYKILRYLIVNYESLILLVQSKLLIYIIVSFANPNRSTVSELEQALKLIREFLNVENGVSLLSCGILKSLISIIYKNEEENKINYIHDKESISQGFKNVCLETICEISMLKPELIFHSGGFKLIINSILEADNIEISFTCLIVLLRILNFENSRKFLRNGYDLDSLISIFSDFENEEGKFKKMINFKLQKISFLISHLLKNFNGLIAFTINEFTSIKNLLNNLRKNNFKTRECILDILLDVFGIAQFPWLKTSSIGNYLSKLGGDSFEFRSIQHPFIKARIHHYQGLLTLVFIKNDIFDHLSYIIEHDQELKSKATTLLTHLYQMANEYLPKELLPSILLPVSSSHSLLDIVNSTMYQIKPNYIKPIIKNEMIITDDHEFRTQLQNCKILTIKEFEDWNWRILSDLITGPLKNIKRFEEVYEKSPKLFKRLSSFYRPFKYRFSIISTKNKHQLKYINVGCQFIELLLSNELGIKYLSTSKLLPQMSEILGQIIPHSGIITKDPILSRRRLETTCSFGYIKFIGILSSHPQGLKMFEQFQFFTSFLNIISHSGTSESNNFFLINLFKVLDYSIEDINNPFKNLIKYSFKKSNLKLRLALVNLLLSNVINIDNFSDTQFIIRILVANLYDINDEIVTRSIDLLLRIFENEDFENLNRLIQLQPSISVLDKYSNGRELLISFLKVSSGFKYLEEYINDKFTKWIDISHFSFLTTIETSITNALFPYAKTKNIDILPLTYLQNLSSTEEGLNFFLIGQGKEFFDNLLTSTGSLFFQVNNQEELFDIDNQTPKNCEVINLLKQNLWIIGCIASGKFGIQLLDPMVTSSMIITEIISNFHSCQMWDIRGVCFYVLGLISSTVEGVEILDEYGWVSVFDQYGKNSRQLTYPIEFSHSLNPFNIFPINPYRDTRYYHIFNSLVEVSSLSQNAEINHKVISLVQNLNIVLSKIENKAVRELNKIKSTNGEIFDDENLFLEIIKLIDKGNYSYHKRVYIFSLFKNTKVLENIGKERRNSFKI